MIENQSQRATIRPLILNNLCPSYRCIVEKQIAVGILTMETHVAGFAKVSYSHMIVSPSVCSQPNGLFSIISLY